MVEMLIVLIVVGIMMSIIGNYFRGMGNEIENATREMAGYFRQIRAEAMVTTSAYRVIVAADNELRGEYARGCGSDDWTEDPRMSLQLRDGSFFGGSGVVTGANLVCFSPRGVADANPVLVVESIRGDRRQVEVLIGGAVLISSPEEEDDDDDPEPEGD